MISIEAFAGARIVLDAALLVVQMNSAARRLLAGNADALAVQHQRLQSPANMQALNRCLSTAVGGHRTAMSLHRPGQQVLTLCAERQSSIDAVWIIVTLRDPELEVPDAALLQDLFGLTPTEARVAAALAQGQDGAGIARAMGVQTNTVQSHIKRVLLKSGTRRQSQLVSLILRSVAMTHTPLAGWPPIKVPGLAQTGNDDGQRAGHSHARPEPATTGCR